MSILDQLGIFLWIWLGSGFLVGIWAVFVEQEKFEEYTKKKEDEGTDETFEDEVTSNIFQSKLGVLAVTTLLGLVSAYALIRSFSIKRGNKKRK